MSKLNKPRLIFGAYLLVLIVAAEILIKHFGLPGWPAFMVMIFFFVEHMAIEKASHILVGGAFGIALVFAAKVFVTGLAPSLGVEPATILFVVVVVYAIVALGEIVPMLFNNYAFMFLTVSALAAKTPDPNPLLWMAVELLGGALLLAGIVVIGKIMAAQGLAPAPAEAEGH